MALIGIDSWQPFPDANGYSVNNTELRVWYNRPFLDSDGISVQGGNGTQGFYITSPVTVTDSLSIASFNLRTTLDAIDPASQSIQCFARLFSNNSPKAWIFAGNSAANGWVIPNPDPLTTMTYEQLAIYNQTTVLANPPLTFWTAAQIQAYFGSLSPAPNASTITKGITYLDVAPTSAISPIAVGINSPRVEWAIYAGNYVTSGAGTLASPYVLNVTAMLAAAGGIGIGLQGRVIIFGPHAYDVGNGIVITDQQVHLIGSSGPGSLGSQPTSSTFLVGDVNAPIIKYANSASLNSFRSRVENMTIMGSVAAGSSQHGVWVDNNGILMNNVGIEMTGGHGLFLTKSSTSGYSNLEISTTAGDGINIDQQSSTDPLAGCHSNVFHRVSVFACSGNGVVFRHGDSNVFYGLDTENNAGRGVWFKHPSGTNEPRYNKVYTYWSETNGLPDEFDGPTQNNHLGYVHNTSGATVVNSTSIGNTFDTVPAYGTPQTRMFPRVIIGKDAAFNTPQDGLLVSDGDFYFTNSLQKFKFSINNSLAQIGVGSSTNIQFLDGVGTSAGSLNLGPGTALFTQILRNLTGVDIRNGDNSAYGPLTAKNLIVANTGLLRVTPKTNDTWGAAISLDVSISNHDITAVFATSSTATITPTGAGTAGDWIFINTVNGVGGTVVVTFASTFHSSGTQSTDASRFSSIAFRSTGTVWVEQYRTTNLA